MSSELAGATGGPAAAAATTTASTTVETHDFLMFALPFHLKPTSPSRDLGADREAPAKLERWVALGVADARHASEPVMLSSPAGHPCAGRLPGKRA